MGVCTSDLNAEVVFKTSEHKASVAANVSTKLFATEIAAAGNAEINVDATSLRADAQGAMRFAFNKTWKKRFRRRNVNTSCADSNPTKQCLESSDITTVQPPKEAGEPKQVDKFEDMPPLADDEDLTQELQKKDAASKSSSGEIVDADRLTEKNFQPEVSMQKLINAAMMPYEYKPPRPKVRVFASLLRFCS
jgi:hypothetical protein